MNASTMDSPSTDEKRQCSSWALYADMAADMVNSLELGDGGFDSDGVLTRPVQSANGSRNLPAMSHHSSSTIPARIRCSEKLMNLFSGGVEDCEHSHSIDLKVQARQQHKKNSGLLCSLSIPVYTTRETGERDPLMEFHERFSKAQGEFNKREAKKRAQQLQDQPKEKILSSKYGASDELFYQKKSVGDGVGDSISSGGETGMKRSTSTCSMTSSTLSMASSFFSLFGNDEAEIFKQSSTEPGKNLIAIQEPTLQTAVDQSRSVKGHRLFVRGGKAAGKGDWKQAVAYYHIALVKQREYYGEDHVVTSSTLNSLGLALMNLGEHFGALTALEEALQIRQDKLGAGSEEAADTTSNICMVLKASADESQ